MRRGRGGVSQRGAGCGSKGQALQGHGRSNRALGIIAGLAGLPCNPCNPSRLQQPRASSKLAPTDSALVCLSRCRLVEKWENRRQMLGAAPMSPSRGPLMSPADRALRAWTNNNTPGSGTDNSGGPGTPASGGAVAASSNNSPAALTAAAAAAGRGIVQLRRFSETGSASVAGSGGSFPSMRRSGVFDSIIARRQPQLLEGAAAGGPGVGSSPAELAAGATAADGSPVRDVNACVRVRWVRVLWLRACAGRMCVWGAVRRGLRESMCIARMYEGAGGGLTLN